MQIFTLSHKQHNLICYMLHCAFIEIRCLAWNDKATQAGDLADLFQNAPLALNKSGFSVFSAMRGGLEYYQAKYHNDENYWRKADYIEMLNDIERTE